MTDKPELSFFLNLWIDNIKSEINGLRRILAEKSNTKINYCDSFFPQLTYNEHTIHG